LEVAPALAEGLSIQQIACKLGIASATVQVHLNTLYWKAGVYPTAGAARTRAAVLYRQHLLVETLTRMALIER
jgi:DNA-binding NarL/FixJ family response regulator